MDDRDEFDDGYDDEYSDEYDEEDEDHLSRLDGEEAVLVRRDLDDLAAFRATFEPEGFKGVSLYCTDCGEEHYYEWDMLEHNLAALLESGATPVHEPAFDPHPDEYVNWEYAQGYVDGLSDADPSAHHGGSLADGQCPFCAAGLPEEPEAVTFCPACGQHLGPARLAEVLEAEGWSRDDVDSLLSLARLPRPRRPER